MYVSDLPNITKVPEQYEYPCRDRVYRDRDRYRDRQRQRQGR